jgi:D-alanyl-D-alanine carboxypeptidase
MGSFAIAKDGKIIYQKAIGFSDVETHKKADVNTVYRIGSISKTFTAVLVMKAIEKGKLKIETPLSSYFPQIKNADKINIESLLRHQSGIHNFTDDVKDYYAYNTQTLSQEKLLEIIIKGGSDFEPNTKYAYSNSNYVLLAMILEKINKKSFAEQISEQITQPLGLKFTGVGKKINSKENVANSYLFVDNKYEKSDETDMSVPLGAGNIVSTPSELLAFINALAEGKLVSKESLEKMKIYKDHYGLGIFEVPFDGKKGFGHNGRIDEFQSVLYYFPDGKTSFAMITNQSNYDNNQISIAALSAAYGLDFKIPSFKKVELKAEDLKQFEGNYASPQFPLKIKVFVENGKLMAQATGQGAFPLEAVSAKEFTFDAAGITLKFNAEKQEMFYTQMGKAINFTKEK